MLSRIFQTFLLCVYYCCSHFLSLSCGQRAGIVRGQGAGKVRARLAPRLGHSLPPQEPNTYAKTVENIVFLRLGATSENLDDGEIFTLRLPFSGCNACGLLWAPHSN